MNVEEIVDWAYEVQAFQKSPLINRITDLEGKVSKAIIDASGWWNCQCHGETKEECGCGAATNFVRYV